MTKRILTVGLLMLGLFTGELRAQLFQSNTGIPALEIYATSGGQTIGGLAAASNGDLYFEVRDTTAGTTELVRLARSPGLPTGYEAAPTSIFTFATAVFPGFVKIFGGDLFFSETTTYNIRRLDLATFAGPLNETTLPQFAQLEGAQDVAFRPGDINASGKALAAYVSAGTFTSSTQIYRLNLATGTSAPVLDSNGDFTGPVAALPNGSLLYGRSGADFSTPKVPGDIFSYSQSEIDAVPSSGGTPLLLDDSHKLISNYSNGLLQVNDSTLLQTEPRGNGNDLLYAYNLFNQGAAPALLGSATSSSNDFSGLAFSAGGVFVALTNFSSFPPTNSAIYQVVPEPSASLLLVATTGLWMMRRRALRSGAGHGNVGK